ncbi:MAG: hypothetical protein QXU72_00145 [Thermofilum sp.]
MPGVPGLNSLKRSRDPEHTPPRPPRDEKFEKLLGKAREKALQWSLATAVLTTAPAMVLLIAVKTGAVALEPGDLILLGIIPALAVFAFLSMYTLLNISLPSLLEAYSFKIYSRLAEGSAAPQQAALQAPAQRPPVQRLPSPVIAPAPAVAPAPARAQPSGQAKAVKPTPITREEGVFAAPSTQPTATPHPAAFSPASLSSPRCPNCGRELPYGDLHLICPFCGARLK